MSGFDEGAVYQSAPPITQGSEPLTIHKDIKHFLETSQDGQTYLYRDQLRRNYESGKYFLEVDLHDIDRHSMNMMESLEKHPSDFVAAFEAVATEFAGEMMLVFDEGLRKHIQVTFKYTRSVPIKLRDLGARQVGALLRIAGIVINATPIKAKPTYIRFKCRNCQHAGAMATKPGLSGTALPRTCQRARTSPDEPRCPIDPYVILPDKCTYIDQQTMKLQELPESVPTGDMPRHVQLSIEGVLADRLVPGTRCTLLGIYSIFSDRRPGAAAAVRTPFVRVLGIQFDSAGRSKTAFKESEEQEFLALSRTPNVYERIVNSIAPAIYGSDDIKKAVAVLLFGGSAKQLPDGMRLRGDINVLLLGDPGTAKSQMLKFVEQVAPVAVYTSGKGSSAAGLTASVLRDHVSREFTLEGGAMVLADGGVVCIDEFDKMREQDRVAIHEAMEQQTISIAKAGITTTLNSRTSVLAAANSVFGRWDDTKDTNENVEFQSTILSRFDLIFVVKDEYDEERDMRLARHVIGVHMHAAEAPEKVGELSVAFLRKYIEYCRTRCGPRLSPTARDKLSNHFIHIRAEMKKKEEEQRHRSAIPITVRQLEALVRISESLAKMSLRPFVTEQHVDEAIRLFKVSTLDAAQTGDVSTTGMDPRGVDELIKIEIAIKTRFAIGSQMAEARLIQEMAHMNYNEAMVRKVIAIMLRRGDLEHQKQRRALYRNF